MASRSLNEIVELIAQLRAPDGCPWDRAQTHLSLAGFLIEEAYETTEAIENEDAQSLKEELGDLLLHVAFHIQLAQEARSFNLHDVLDSLHDKIIRRHPHVFGDSSGKLEDVKQRWEELKKEENQNLVKSPSHLPALIEGRKLMDRASNLGIDLQELSDSIEPDDVSQLLLEAVAIAHDQNLEPELCLKKALKRVSDKLDEVQSERTTQ